MNSIFVQIASYRDPQLIPTLKSLIDNAKSPKNLTIGICWQHADDETVELFLDEGFDIVDADVDTDKKLISLSYNKAKLKVIDIHYLETQGACWARHAIQQLYDGEKYTLQLDSHHRFVKNWDSILIDMLESVREDSPKPLLTSYISSFDPENDPTMRIQEPWKMDFDRFIPEGAVFFLPSTIEDYKTRTKPLRGRFYSAHFAFADGSFAVEVQHDPEYFFHGEEISIAARAFTHGYDLYHPHKTVAWHEYTRKGRIKVWDDHTTPQKNKGKVKLDWVERNNICHNRNRILFGMDGLDPTSIDFGKYGFGTERTLREYEEYAGISFKHRSVTQTTIDRLEPEVPQKGSQYTEEEWEDKLTRSNDIHVLLHKNELLMDDELPDDYDFWYIGAHDSDNVEVFRKDKNAAEVKPLLKTEWVDFRLIYLSNKETKTYTVWPHSTSRGWCNKITKNVT